LGRNLLQTVQELSGSGSCQHKPADDNPVRLECLAATESSKRILASVIAILPWIIPTPQISLAKISFS
jgi:hypothetical protein